MTLLPFVNIILVAFYLKNAKGLEHNKISFFLSKWAQEIAKFAEFHQLLFHAMLNYCNFFKLFTTSLNSQISFSWCKKLLYIPYESVIFSLNLQCCILSIQKMYAKCQVTNHVQKKRSSRKFMWIYNKYTKEKSKLRLLQQMSFCKHQVVL